MLCEFGMASSSARNGRTPARHGLGRNRISYRGHPVSEADALVPGLQTLEGVPDDDIVHAIASAQEGPNVATDLAPEASNVRCLHVHPAPPARECRQFTPGDGPDGQTGAPSWSKVAND